MSKKKKSPLERALEMRNKALLSFGKLERVYSIGPRDEVIAYEEIRESLMKGAFDPVICPQCELRMPACICKEPVI